MEESGEGPLSALQPGVVALVEVPGDAYMDALAGLVHALQADGASGIIVNASRPSETLASELDKRGVDLQRLAFVDCISRLVKADVQDSDRRIFLDSPTMLEMIAMGVDHFLDDVAPGGFVVFDSYGSLIQYNNFQLVYEFSNFLINKLRLRRMRGALVIVKGQLGDQARSSLAQLSDTVIDWGERHG